MRPEDIKVGTVFKNNINGRINVVTTLLANNEVESKNIPRLKRKPKNLLKNVTFNLDLN